MTSSFIQTIADLERRLAGPLPGKEAQIRMAPGRADALDRTNVSGRTCREAGVLALLHPVHDEAHIVLTVRHSSLADHAGQIALPGGRREGDEPLLQTALREAQEEVSVSPGDVEVLGGLTPLYIPPSNFCVYPYLGYTTSQMNFRPQDLEVERIVHVPLQDLLGENVARVDDWTVGEALLRVPYFDVAGLQIWGATAMMLSELIALLEK